MTNKLIALYIFVILFFAASVSVFADNSHSVSSPTFNASVLQDPVILKRNQEREKKAQEYFKKGTALAKAGNLSEARDYFEKAIRITNNPEMASSSQGLEASYQAAIVLYQQKKYSNAKDAFETINANSFDYRGTNSYLEIIGQDIARQQSEDEAARAKEKADKLAQIQAKEKERQDALNRQAESVYNQALDLYKNKDFTEAKKKFQEVSWVVPNYKDTTRILGRIDRDAKIEQDRLNREQQRAMEKQQREAQRQRERAEKKHEQDEARQKAEMEAKALQHKEDIEDHAEYLYRSAVDFFNQKNMIEALGKFKDIEVIVPDYKSTRTYIARIDQWKIDQEKMVLESEKEAQEEAVRQKEIAQERQREEAIQDKNDKAQNLYNQALDLYRAQQWEQSENQFESVEQIVPDFKRTHRYLQKLTIIIAKNNSAKPKLIVNTPSSTDGTMLAPIKVAVSLQDQQKQAQDIAALAEKSAELYRKIADIANDDTTVQAKRKMAEVDDMLNTLKDSKEHFVHQLQDEQACRLAEEEKAREEERLDKAEKMYQNALDFVHVRDYTTAKVKFLQLESFYPDYKTTRHFLSHIDEDIKRANAEAITNYEKMQAQRLKDLQDKADAEEARREEEEKERQHNKEYQEQLNLKELAQRASDINDDIIQLSRKQDYDGMKIKFAELEKTVTALTTLKVQIDQEHSLKERDKELVRESVRRHNEMLRAQKQEESQLQSYYNVQPLRVYRPVLSTQPEGIEQFKKRDIMQEQNVLFNEAVDRFNHHKYTQAKLLFGELADQNDRRAEPWIKKVDRAITRELLRSQESEESERTAFIADQVKAQRELLVIQERERERQKRLTEELERQKRLYEDDRLLQLRKEELLKSQERERERQEEKRRELEKVDAKKEQLLRFHKIELVVKPQAPIVQVPVVQVPDVQPHPPVVVKPVQVIQVFPVVAPPAPKPIVVPMVTPQPAVIKPSADEIRRQKQLEEQQAQLKAAAEARQKRIEERQKEREHEEEVRARRAAERQARIKAAAELRQKRIEERQKEREHEQELKAQREAEHQARLKAEADARALEAKAQAERLAQEEKQRQEVIRQEAQQREERIKQEEIMRQEDERRQELERQERQRQADLEAQRAAVRKQLEDGVEDMYQEALVLFKQGNFSAAADKFKDVQDILPGYKRSAEYMDEARQKALSVNNTQALAAPIVPVVVAAPTPIATAAPTPAVPVPAPTTTTTVSRQSNVSKALDLFDPNAK